jgi:hypothetical protein
MNAIIPIKRSLNQLDSDRGHFIINQNARPSAKWGKLSHDLVIIECMCLASSSKRWFHGKGRGMQWGVVLGFFRSFQLKCKWCYYCYNLPVFTRLPCWLSWLAERRVESMERRAAAMIDDAVRWRGDLRAIPIG